MLKEKRDKRKAQSVLNGIKEVVTSGQYPTQLSIKLVQKELNKNLSSEGNTEIRKLMQMYLKEVPNSSPVKQQHLPILPVGFGF